MPFTFSARRVSDIEDVRGDGVEVLGRVVQPVYHSLHSFLVVLHDCRMKKVKMQKMRTSKRRNSGENDTNRDSTMFSPSPSCVTPLGYMICGPPS